MLELANSSLSPEPIVAAPMSALGTDEVNRVRQFAVELRALGLSAPSEDELQHVSGAHLSPTIIRTIDEVQGVVAAYARALNAERDAINQVDTSIRRDGDATIDLRDQRTRLREIDMLEAGRAITPASAQRRRGLQQMRVDQASAALVNNRIALERRTWKELQVMAQTPEARAAYEAIAVQLTDILAAIRRAIVLPPAPAPEPVPEPKAAEPSAQDDERPRTLPPPRASRSKKKKTPGSRDQKRRTRSVASSPSDRTRVKTIFIRPEKDGTLPLGRILKEHFPSLPGKRTHSAERPVAQQGTVLITDPSRPVTVFDAGSAEAIVSSVLPHSSLPLTAPAALRQSPRLSSAYSALLTRNDDIINASGMEYSSEVTRGSIDRKEPFVAPDGTLQTRNIHLDISVNRGRIFTEEHMQEQWVGGILPAMSSVIQAERFASQSEIVSINGLLSISMMTAQKTLENIPDPTERLFVAHSLIADASKCESVHDRIARLGIARTMIGALTPGGHLPAEDARLYEWLANQDDFIGNTVTLPSNPQVAQMLGTLRRYAQAAGLNLQVFESRLLRLLNRELPLDDARQELARELDQSYVPFFEAFHDHLFAISSAKLNLSEEQRRFAVGEWCRKRLDAPQGSVGCFQRVIASRILLDCIKKLEGSAH